MLTKIRIGLLLGVIICLVAFNANAAVVQIPSRNVRAGERIILPIQLRNIPQETYGINFHINYDPAVILSPQIEYDSNASTLLISNIISPGKLAVGLASSKPLSRNSSLGVLIFNIADTKLSSTKFEISNILINEDINYIPSLVTKLYIIKPPIINYLEKDEKYFFWEGQGNNNSFWKRILRYRYRIDSKKWQYTWARKILVQSVTRGLNNGSHTFEIQAINLKGITSKIKSVKFETASPYLHETL